MKNEEVRVEEKQLFLGFISPFKTQQVANEAHLKALLSHVSPGSGLDLCDGAEPVYVLKNIHVLK